MTYTVQPDLYEVIEYTGSNASDIQQWLVDNQFGNYLGSAEVLERLNGNRIAICLPGDNEHAVLVHTGQFLAVRTTYARERLRGESYQTEFLAVNAESIGADLVPTI